MARARNIKPGTFKNEVLGVADPIYTLLFEGLWLLADREGRLEDRPLRIKGEIFPYRDGLDVDALLNWLQANGFIRRYVADGMRCIVVLEFMKHQNPHKNEPESVLPAPGAIHATTDGIGTAPEKIGSAPADSLIPDSGFTDSGSLTAEGAAPPAAPSPAPTPAPTPAPAPAPDKALNAHDLVAEGVDEQHAKDWLKVRAKHKAPLTLTAWSGLKAEAGRAGISAAEAVRICAEKSWRGFDSTWDWPGKRAVGPPGRVTQPSKQTELESRNAATAARLSERFSATT